MRQCKTIKSAYKIRMENHLVHFCCEDGRYIGECYWNDMDGGMQKWLRDNIGEAGQYICKVYDLDANTEPREVKVTLP